MNANDKIYVAGHNGLVGSAIVRCLHRNNFTNVIVRDSRELDLREQGAVRAFFDEQKPEYVFLAAAKVGGIYANSTYPAEFIYDNLQIQNNIVDAAYRAGAKKLLFLGSSCIYPRLCPQPIKEEYLLSGPLEETNEWYAMAKISGIKLCQAYKKQYGFPSASVMPTNLYGPKDNYHPENSHVIPALIRRFHEAKIADVPEVVIWGTGKPRREFLYVDDLADATLFVMQNYDGFEHINIGSGEDHTILEIAQMVADTVGFTGKIATNPDMPDGTPRKLLDTSKLLALGWKPKVGLREGLANSYAWYLENVVGDGSHMRTN